MNHKKIGLISEASLIAAMYAALTAISHLLGLSGGVLQLRLSECLCVLPFFTPAAVPGLFIGCFLSNILTGCAIWDVIFGSLATLLSALLSYALRRFKWLVPLPPVLINTAVIPFLLKLTYGSDKALPYLFLSIGISELVSAGVLGMILLFSLQKYSKFIFTRR